MKSSLQPGVAIVDGSLATAYRQGWLRWLGHPGVTDPQDEWTEVGMSGTGDEAAAGGVCAVHLPRAARRSLPSAWDAPPSEAPEPELPRVGRFPAVQAGQPAIERIPPTSALIGYRGPTACAAAGITYRQLDYWARTGLLEPSVRTAYPAGAQRLYAFRDILFLKVVKRLLDAGVSLQNIRVAVAHLQAADLGGGWPTSP
ncbi:hypothetical protein GCM10025734_20240 [Kitasatospora paranensis]